MSSSPTHHVRPPGIGSLCLVLSHRLDFLHLMLGALSRSVVLPPSALPSLPDLKYLIRLVPRDCLTSATRTAHSCYLLCKRALYGIALTCLL
jgi:hypothetical protein